MSNTLGTVGTIALFPESRIPVDWILCNGMSVSVSAHPALYALIMNTYGGDSKNFNVPNIPSDIKGYQYLINFDGGEASFSDASGGN